jgi:hypothetical protein
MDVDMDMTLIIVNEWEIKTEPDLKIAIEKLFTMT